jgi:hypothetical protein
MDVRVEATVATVGVDILHASVAAVRRFIPTVMVPRQRAVASYPASLSFGNTSLSAVAPDLSKNGGLYALV